MQIGVMGSAADLDDFETYEKLAKELGLEIAKRGHVLIFGAEKDCNSLSTLAAKTARENGGVSVAVTYGKGLDIFDKESADHIITCGLERGGGREFVLVLSCEVIITINGGSGTLNEMVIAYQAGIPIISLGDSGGWSGKMAGEYFDDRKRLMVQSAKSIKEAVELAEASL